MIATEDTWPIHQADPMMTTVQVDEPMGQKRHKPSSYDDDFYGWATEQAALLRRGQFAEADVANIVEEIETLGRSERRSLESAYRLIAAHLLKGIYQPGRATRSWINTIVRERNAVESILEASPSLKAARGDLFVRAYRQARKEAASETSLPLEVFPEQPPFTLAEAEDDTFMPLAVAPALGKEEPEQGESHDH